MISEKWQKVTQKAVRWPCGVCGRGVGNNYIHQVNGVNGGYTVMLDSVCHQSINRL